jgi:hypothetical protein
MEALMDASNAPQQNSEHPMHLAVFFEPLRQGSAADLFE